MERLPAPENNKQQCDQGSPDARKQRRKPGVPSVDECLAALGAIPRLVVLGLISPAQANSLRATYLAILNHHGKHDAAAQRRPVDQAGLRQILRAYPQLANSLAGVLSDEDIDNLLSGEDE